ncbi:ribonuclease T2 [Leucosporidium creatinivorum]|uniref:ribonuclease T2 n=1 Tax=Leucosporidium creatinivorum TaxID=106004 RepID=A0A1Y2FWN1_9BASI|nr:ribonuclease T2 [Leucosporidium creatinivorum]
MLAPLTVLAVAAPLAASALSLPSVTPAFTYPSLKNCPVSTEYSCTTDVSPENTCCAPGAGQGLFLATQFWNTFTGLEDKGQFLPKNSWGIHGLWSDFCDGTYTQYCDLSRQYDPSPSPNTTNGLPNGTVVPPYTGKETATSMLQRFGRFDLARYVDGFWINRGDTNDVLHQHEFSKHGTCMTTFDKACYSDYQEGQDFVDYIAAAVRANKQFPTFDILATRGIYPSNSTTTTLAEMNAAFLSSTGAIPYFGCVADETGAKTVLTEVWVYNHVLGTPQFGQYSPVNTTYPSTCSNSTGIHYYERTVGSEVSKWA